MQQGSCFDGIKKLFAFVVFSKLFRDVPLIIVNKQSYWMEYVKHILSTFVKTILATTTPLTTLIKIYLAEHPYDWHVYFEAKMPFIWEVNE